MSQAAFNQAGIAQGNQDAMSQAGFNQSATAANNASAMQQAQFGNQARAQGLEQLFALRNQPLNEYNALRSSAQVAQPEFQNAQNSLTNAADAQGNINLPLGIPNSLAMVNTSLAFQYLAVDLGLAFALPIGHTNGVELRFGN